MHKTLDMWNQLNEMCAEWNLPAPRMEPWLNEQIIIWIKDKVCYRSKSMQTAIQEALIWVAGYIDGRNHGN